MPSTPYARLLASINGGAATHGASVAANSDTVQFTAESTAQWDLTTPPRWEIYAYPPTWTGPASGWTTESVPQPGGGSADVYVYLGLGPPPAFTLPALPMWGDFLCKLTVQGGLLNGLPNSNLVDDRTALRIVGPGGLTDIAVTDSGQFDPARSWVGSWQNDLRILDAALVGAATPYTSTPEPIEIGAGSDGAVLNYSKGDHSHPVTVGTPTTLAIGDAAAAGAGTTLAGAAHVHALPAPTVVSDVSSGASSLGASTATAREDHSHQLTFTTLNSILAAANAPITVNGQTLTSGGFIGPYFATDAANPSTTGLLRAAKNTVALAFRDDALAADINAVSMTTTDVLVFGASNAVETRLVTQAGGTIGFYDASANILNAQLAGITWDVGATFRLAQTAGGGDATIEAAGAGSPLSNGSNLVLESGDAGALGSPGEIRLDAKANGAGTLSGRISMRGGPFNEFLRFSYNGSTNRTSIEAGADFTRLTTKVLELDATNLAVFATTGSYGGGVKTAYIADATTEPTGDCTTGARVWSYSTALKAQNYALTVLAPQVESAAGSEDLRAPDRRAKRIQTTNATPTTIYTFALPTSCSAHFEVIITAYTPADGTSATYKVEGGAKRFGAGAATLIGTPVTTPWEDNAAMDAVLDVSGNNVIVVVTGIAATTIEWFVTPNVTLMKPA